jgi:hypothetical protein
MIADLVRIEAALERGIRQESLIEAVVVAGHLEITDTKRNKKSRLYFAHLGDLEYANIGFSDCINALVISHRYDTPVVLQPKRETIAAGTGETPYL